MVTVKRLQETPAEQLLRMIEGPQGGLPGAAKPVAGALHALAGFFRRLPNPFRRKFRSGRRESDPVLANLTLAQRVLWAVMILFGAYVAFDLVMVQPKSTLDRVTAQAPASPDAAQGPASSGTALKPLADYLSVVQQVNPFGGAAALVAAPVQQTTKQRMQELAGGLAVVGIDRSANPEAIIEDTNEKRTYFVKVGDELNGMTIRDISAKGVTVTYEGEELLLK